MISIIIATFNSSRTLAKALESVLEQNFNDWECIIVDGKSTDSTLDIIKEFELKDSRFSHVSEKDNGIYDAFNKYKKGLITLQDYTKIFNDWAVPLGGRPLQFTTNSYGRVLPIHPHPYIYIKRKGGKLNGKD